MERIVFLDRKTCRVDFRPPRFQHEWDEYDVTAPSETVERLRNATVAITNKVAIREAELKDLPALKLILVAATGVDIIDLAACRKRGIVVSNVPHYTTHSVPEHVFMLVLALRRNLLRYHDAVRAGGWSRSPIFTLADYPIQNLHGSTLGIIGYGRLGKEVEKIARAFGMDVLIAERRHEFKIRPGRTPFDETLGKSDVVTLHAPLDPSTRKLMGSTELGKMKPTALLINTARGGLVDEIALTTALKSGFIGGAGLDVLTEEPPPADNPLLELKLPNLIITPHIAWSSERSLQILAEQVITNLEAFVAGAPQNVVS